MRLSREVGEAFLTLPGNFPGKALRSRSELPGSRKLDEFPQQRSTRSPYASSNCGHMGDMSLEQFGVHGKVTGANRSLEALYAQGSRACLQTLGVVGTPARYGRGEADECRARPFDDRAVYRTRNHVERLINRLKLFRCRQPATRNAPKSPVRYGSPQQRSCGSSVRIQCDRPFPTLYY
jgi:hypothetical protein